MTEPPLSSPVGPNSSSRLLRPRDVSAFLERLSSGDGYRFARAADATLLSTAFALQTLALLNEERTPEIARALERLRASQTPSGSFADPLFSTTDTRGTHSAEYISWQTNFFALSALDAWRVRPAYPLAFVDPFTREPELTRWLEARDWKNFWYSSNEIMFLLTFLSYRWLRSGDEQAKLAAERCLESMDARQLHDTGFWGNPQTPANGMYGAAHIYMFYDFYDRRIPRADRILDATLAMQTRTGLWAAWHGGACEDYDGIEILLKVGRHTSHRALDVRSALERAALAISSAQQRSGGFSYRVVPASAKFLDRLSALRSHRRKYTFSGWNRMRVRSFEADTWATFFRTLALASIERTLTTATPYRFCELPCWGYFERLR